MSKQHSEETKRKISESIRRTNQRKKVEKENQDLADSILSNFEKGSGKKATKLSRLAKHEEYQQIGDGQQKKQPVGAEAEIGARRQERIAGPEHLRSPQDGQNSGSKPVR